MKKRVGFTIVDDAVVEALYRVACEAFILENKRLTSTRSRDAVLP